ncbi:hypothetical protein QCN29_24125 [Streptomyces sp. HNM0663]|uniref:Uncharacterized protein n=1 Tax=Streptomyces chengmaiensis TaxID=3040919 RepID=A0ABT6HSW7_9ACTN|nr:hypothetical protein [Streptomyces chengmaiensis]MDH2391808.1 hypothetical protein [Streptomyces chengmaiensis]
MHHHGYTWLGSGFELHRDGPRRHGHPDFEASGVPPLEVAQWLLKSPRLIQGSWEEDPDGAARWYGEQARAHARGFADPHDREVLERRVRGVPERLRQGQDAVGGWWLDGRRFLAVVLVGCSPHALRAEYHCPRH